MRVGKSVSKAMIEMDAGDAESAMIHACNAIDGTGRKQYPGQRSVTRFTRVLRENYLILGTMGARGINLEDSRFDVEVKRPTAPNGGVDIADVIYGVHRCSHAHGDELPHGFELMPDLRRGSEWTSLRVDPVNGTVRLSDRIIYGLIAVAVLSPVNVGERAPQGQHLTFGSDRAFVINEWWGRASEFRAFAEALPPPPVFRRERIPSPAKS